MWLEGVATPCITKTILLRRMKMENPKKMYPQKTWKFSQDLAFSLEN
jgi:hypothetical protein